MKTLAELLGQGPASLQCKVNLHGTGSLFPGPDSGVLSVVAQALATHPGPVPSTDAFQATLLDFVSGNLDVGALPVAAFLSLRPDAVLLRDTVLRKRAGVRGRRMLKRSAPQSDSDTEERVLRARLEEIEAQVFGQAPHLQALRAIEEIVHLTEASAEQEPEDAEANVEELVDEQPEDEAPEDKDAVEDEDAPEDEDANEKPEDAEQPDDAEEATEDKDAEAPEDEDAEANNVPVDHNAVEAEADEEPVEQPDHNAVEAEADEEPVEQPEDTEAADKSPEDMDHRAVEDGPPADVPVDLDTLIDELFEASGEPTREGTEDMPNEDKGTAEENTDNEGPEHTEDETPGEAAEEPVKVPKTTSGSTWHQHMRDSRTNPLVLRLPRAARFAAARALWWEQPETAGHPLRGKKAVQALCLVLATLGLPPVVTVPAAGIAGALAEAADQGNASAQQRPGCSRCRWNSKGCPPSCIRRRDRNRTPPPASAPASSSNEPWVHRLTPAEEDSLDRAPTLVMGPGSGAEDSDHAPTLTMGPGDVSDPGTPSWLEPAASRENPEGTGLGDDPENNPEA